MSKRKHTYPLTAAALALTVMAANPAAAAETGASSSVSTRSAQGFTDVSASHWAIKHITKLAALGVIEGYERGEYRPENSVSQQEVIVMALRMMGLESEVKKSSVATAFPFLVDDFFKPYVAYAFDRGLIDIGEETEGTTAKTQWGRKEATREWVAKLVIRTIGKEKLADSLADDTPPFNDSKDLSSWAAGYINAAVDLKIVDGFEDGSFKPKGTVTRAQMATFLSRAEKDMPSAPERVTTGYILEMNSNKLVLLTKDEKKVEYKLGSNTVIYKREDDSRIPASDLKLTNEIYLIQNGGNVSYIELLDDKQQLETFEGTLSELFVDDMIVSLQQGSAKKLYQLDSNVTVTDKDGRGLSLNGIATGSIVQLSRNPLLKEEKITQIVVKQAPVSKTAEGTVVSVDREQNVVSFLETSTGATETYGIGAKTTLTLADGSAADLSRLTAGDIVSYEIKANELVSMKVTKAADVSISEQGKLTAINHDTRTLTINRSGNALDAYYFADNAIVSIDGLPAATFYDLEIGDELKLDIVNNEVIKATVTSRAIEQLTFATILNYSTQSKVLTVSKHDGSVGAYKLTDSTAIRYAESNLNLNNFDRFFLDKADKKVNIKASKDRIIEIDYALDIDGSIQQVNTTSYDVTIRTAGGQTLTFRAPSAVPVESQDGKKTGLGELKPGDNVRLRLSNSQDLVTSITVKKTGLYRVTGVNTNRSELTVKDENGKSLTIEIDSNNQIINPGKPTHDLKDIQVDEFVKAAFNGSELEHVTLLNAVRGKVTAVDLAANTITVQDYNKGIQVVPVGQLFTVKQNGASYTTLSSIKANDRVEIVKNTDDKATIYVATSAKRVVQSYDSVLSRMSFKASDSDGKSTYYFFAKAYLHKGGDTVTPGAFAENEEVTVYILDDKIVEIEK